MGTAAKPTRENRTITVDFQNETTYVELLGDGKAFVEWVLAFILSLGFQLKHKAACRGGASGMLAGRAVWTATLGADDPTELLRRHSVPRLRELAEIVDRHGRPWREKGAR